VVGAIWKVEKKTFISSSHSGIWPICNTCPNLESHHRAQSRPTSPRREWICDMSS